MNHLADKLSKADIVSYESIELRSGVKSDFYADIKKAYGDPELLTAMAEATVENLDPRTTCIAASGYGGVPLGVAVSRVSGLPLTLIRDTEKGHGRGGLIDGYVPSSSDIVSIVDDVFTSGSSLKLTAENLASCGAEIAGCHVIVARGGSRDFEMPISYLVTVEEITNS